jgi:hypothetical protein
VSEGKREIQENRNWQLTVIDGYLADPDDRVESSRRRLGTPHGSPKYRLDGRNRSVCVSHLWPSAISFGRHHAGCSTKPGLVRARVVSEKGNKRVYDDHTPEPKR